MEMKWWISFLLAYSEIVRSSTSRVSEEGVLYRRITGLELRSPCSLVLKNVASFRLCVLHCTTTSTCNAGSYHAVRKNCCVGNGGVFDFNAVYAEDSNSIFFQKWQDYVYYDGWALAFKACSSCGKSVYGAWSNTSQQDDALVGTSDLPWGCVTFRSMACGRHFRSKLLDNWASLGVKEVSLRMYNSSAKLVDVSFNGTGSTVTSWMSPSRLLKSPWTDATTNPSSYNVFGINIVPQDKRYFFINKNYGGCSIDSGWMVALDVRSGSAGCFWERLPYPAFVYSTATTVTRWQSYSSTLGHADVMAIFVKF